MLSSLACISVPSFFGSAEVWPSRLVKLNVHFSLCTCLHVVLVCVCVCVCVCGVCVCACMCVCGVVWCVCVCMCVCVCVLHFLLDCCLLEHA